MDHITKALSGVLRAEPLASGMLGWRAVELWNDIVGESIARHSQAVRFRDGQLTVEVESSAWVQELSYLKADIQRRLNDALIGSATTKRPIHAIQLVLAGRRPRLAPGMQHDVTSRGPAKDRR